MPKAIALILMAVPAIAGPTYNFFYPCSSGIVDCSAFPKHENGPVAVTQAFDWSDQTAVSMFRVFVDASNTSGEGIGTIMPVGSEYVYGTIIIGGTAYFGFRLPGDIPGSGEIPVDVNDNGLFLFNGVEEGGFGVPWIGSAPNNGDLLVTFVNPASIEQQFGVSSPCLSEFPDCGPGTFQLFNPQGINDSDQILVDLEIVNADGTITGGEGVLSPTAVPEPASIILLGTILIGVSFRIKRKFLVTDALYHRCLPALPDPTPVLRGLLLIALMTSGAHADVFQINFYPTSDTSIIDGEPVPYPLGLTGTFTTDGICDICTISQQAPGDYTSDGLLGIVVTGNHGFPWGLGDDSLFIQEDGNAEYDRLTNTFFAALNNDGPLRLNFDGSTGIGGYAALAASTVQESGTVSIEPEPVPEPTSIVLLETIVIGVGLATRRKISRYRRRDGSRPLVPREGRTNS